MRFLPLLMSMILMLAAGQVHAQADGAAVDGTPEGAETANQGADGREPPEWRSTAGYPFPALADTVARMQNVAHAMRLRDYCADRRVPDEFVRARLQRFSQLTGREETCTTLLDY
ncbi:hypothetical protein [Thauera mechernichensis]